jgi:hypothetical protein
LLTNKLGWISFVIAGVVHAADVSRNVFKAWQLGLLGRKKVHKMVKFRY